MENQVLGFVGVGRMGGPMASRLLDAGHSLCVFDTNAEAIKPLVARGAKAAGSPAEVGSAARVVLMSLPTPAIVQAVALGSEGITRGSSVKVLIDLSTTGPGMSTIVARGANERGIVSVDAPVSGGIKGAEGGTLAVMVSCPQHALPEVEPILKTFGKLFYTGEKPGLAQVAKLANNLLAAAAMVVSSEVLAMGVKAGLDPQGPVSTSSTPAAAATARRRTSSRGRFSPAPSTSGSRPACRTKTCASAWTRPRRWACRWSSAPPCARCSPSPRRSSAPRPISPASPRWSRNGQGSKFDRRQTVRT